MYDAWCVRLERRVTIAEFKEPIRVSQLVIATDELRKPRNPVAPIKVRRADWECPHCGACNVIKLGFLPVMSLTCFNCAKEVEGVMTDSNHDILVEGRPFPT